MNESNLWWRHTRKFAEAWSLPTQLITQTMATHDTFLIFIQETFLKSQLRVIYEFFRHPVCTGVLMCAH